MSDIGDIRVYVFHYKEDAVLKTDPVYQPVMAGNALVSGNCSISGDDTGENISLRNRYFSELTGIYWIWKNTRQDVCGTSHYRRFFTARPEPLVYKIKRLLYYPTGLYKKRSGLIYTGNSRLFAPRIISSAEIRRILEDYDAILPEARKLGYSVETHFQRYHHAENLKLLRLILKEKYPGFSDAFETVLKGKRLYANNMFIMKDHHFQEFMEWWFDILFEFEQRIDLTQYTGYQERVLGFIAERLLNVWFMKKQLKCKELQVIYFKHFKHT